MCVDWVSPHGPWDDSLMFIFDGGVLSEEQIAGLRLLDVSWQPWSSVMPMRLLIGCARMYSGGWRRRCGLWSPGRWYISRTVSCPSQAGGLPQFGSSAEAGGGEVRGRR